MAETLAAETALGWVWGVHIETSTGILNDLDGLRVVAAARAFGSASTE